MSSLPVEQRAGGIVLRKKQGQLEYLLVTSNSNYNRWIIPAGHVEQGETFEVTALREVMEEAGVEAKTVVSLGNLQYFWYRENQKILINTYLFLMEFIKTVNLNPEGRQVSFFTFDQAMELNLWDESKSLLQKADQLAKSIYFKE